MNKILDKQDKVGIKEFIIIMKIMMNRREICKGQKRKIRILKENKGEIMQIVREECRTKIKIELEKDIKAMVSEIKGLQLLKWQTKIIFRLKESIIKEIKIVCNYNSKDKDENEDKIINISQKNRNNKDN